MQSGALRLRSKRTASRSTALDTLSRPAERNRSLATWLGVIAAVAAAVAAVMSALVASQQEDAAYKTIVVAREVEVAGVLLDRGTTYLQTVGELQGRIGFMMDKRFSDIVHSPQERESILKTSARISPVLSEFATAVGQLQLLLPEDSRFLQNMWLNFKMVDIFFGREVGRFQLHRQRAQWTTSAELGKYLEEANQDLHVFRTCARSSLARGRPIEIETFEGCAQHHQNLFRELKNYHDGGVLK